MKKKSLVLAIAIVLCLSITCLFSMKSDSNDRVSCLFIENVEALASGENDSSPCIFRLTYKCMYYVKYSDWSGVFKFEDDAIIRN